MATEILSIFHNGLFAGYYICAAIAIIVHHKELKGTKPLAWVSFASAFAHVFSFLLLQFAPDNQYLLVGLASYYTWASPSIMYCIKEATTPGWLTLKRYAIYMCPFAICTFLCLVTGSQTALIIETALAFYYTIFCFFKLNKDVMEHERRIKEYFTDLESYGHGWIKGFIYFQIITSICLFLFLFYHNEYFNIFWNYLMAGYWSYFLVRSKIQRYYSLQVPEVVTEKPIEENPQPETKIDKSGIVPSTIVYIEKRLNDLGDEIYYNNSNLTLVSLAQMVGTNRTYMSVYFRAKNTTFWDYVNNKRCDHAIELMKKDQTIPIIELAQLCGFRTVNCFRTTFTTIHGTNPSTYKKTMI